MKKLLLVLVVVALTFTSCTENKRAKGWGGTATIDLPKGKKLITVTWKEDEIWFLTKPMASNDVVETYEFQEESSWGIVEGTVVIKESK